MTLDPKLFGQRGFDCGKIKSLTGRDVPHLLRRYGAHKLCPGTRQKSASELEQTYNFDMRGWLSIATVGAALLTTSAGAQMRGSRPGFAGARPGIVVRSPMMPRSTIIARPAPGFFRPKGNTFFFHRGFHRPFFFGHRFRHHRRLFFGGFGLPYGYYGYYPGYYAAYPMFSDTYADANADVYAQQSYMLQQEVSRLSDEVQRLREQQAELRSAPPPAPSQPPQAQPQTKAPPTKLVFRDGKTLEVQNYAIAGQTMWVFSEQRARKIPLSQLDIPATQKANEQRGVPFQVPSAR
ncbi:MAG: hypothetical protein ACE14M_01740 [Terriglobales bacterium]